MSVESTVQYTLKENLQYYVFCTSKILNICENIHNFLSVKETTIGLFLLLLCYKNKTFP